MAAQLIRRRLSLDETISTKRGCGGDGVGPRDVRCVVRCVVRRDSNHSCQSVADLRRRGSHKKPNNKKQTKKSPRRQGSFRFVLLWSIVYNLKFEIILVRQKVGSNAVNTLVLFRPLSFVGCWLLTAQQKGEAQNQASKYCSHHEVCQSLSCRPPGSIMQHGRMPVSRSLDRKAQPP